MDTGMRFREEDLELAGRKAMKVDIRPCGRDGRKASYEVMDGIGRKCPWDTAVVFEEFRGGTKGNICWGIRLGMACWNTGKEEVCGSGDEGGGGLHQPVVKRGGSVIGGNRNGTLEEDAPRIHPCVKEKSA